MARHTRHSQAGVHIEDRGYQFADGVYEVIVVVEGRMVDEDLHFARLERSLREIRMGMPFGVDVFRLKVAELLRLNRLSNASLYIQVSRGVAPRNHQIPDEIQLAVVMTVRPLAGTKAGNVKDRFNHYGPRYPLETADIKSVSLIPNICQGCRRAPWRVRGMAVDNGMVTEGTSPMHGS